VAAVVGFGCWFVRKSGTTSEFMAAGGSLPGWAVGLSIFGTYLSSNTFLGVPGKAYGENFNGFVFSLSLPLAAFIATRFFVPFYRRTGEISAYHHLEQRFGLWARTYAVVCYLLTQIARTGTILFGVALGLQALTDWPVVWIIVITGVLVTLYTLLGGIEAVIWTDVIQSLVLLGGALLVLGMLLVDAPEGPQRAVTLAAEQDKFSLGSFAFNWTSSTVWVMLLFGLFINLNNFGIDQSFVQRFHTARSDREAGRAIWLGALLYVPVSLLFFFIGAMLYSYYELRPELLAEVRQQVATEQLASEQLLVATVPPSEVAARAAQLEPREIGDKVLPHFLATQLPPGVAGLLIAAIFAAAMSSVDTSLNSSATVFLKDIVQRYFAPAISEASAMTVLRAATIGMGLIGTGVALALIGEESILEAWWVLQGVFAGGLLGLFLLGIISRRAGNPEAVTATLIGISVIAWMTLSPGAASLPPPLRSGLHANLTIVVGTLTIFGVGLLLSRLRRPERDQ
jgi:SSS family solute:Na+ symporter